MGGHHIAELPLQEEPMLKLIRQEEGVTAIEYALIAALIAIAIIAAVTLVGTNISNTFNNVANAI